MNPVYDIDHRLMVGNLLLEFGRGCDQKRHFASPVAASTFSSGLNYEFKNMLERDNYSYICNSNCNYIMIKCQYEYLYPEIVS